MPLSFSELVMTAAADDDDVVFGRSLPKQDTRLSL